MVRDRLLFPHFGGVDELAMRERKAGTRRNSVRWRGSAAPPGLTKYAVASRSALRAHTTTKATKARNGLDTIREPWSALCLYPGSEEQRPRPDVPGGRRRVVT